MNDSEIKLLNLCLADSLFCALYNALCRLKQKWQTQTPVSIWTAALQARNNLAQSPRPEMLLGSLFDGMTPQDTLLVSMVLMYMLCTEENWSIKSHLKDKLSKMLQSYGQECQEAYDEFYRSEEENELMGYEVTPADYSHSQVLDTLSQPVHTADEVVSNIVDNCRDTSEGFVQMVLLILQRANDQHNHAYDRHIDRLREIIRKKTTPQVHNNFQREVHLHDTSTLNGDVIVTSAN